MQRKGDINMFLDELKQSIDERNAQIDNVRTQAVNLKEEKEKKQEDIAALRNEFAISLDASIMEQIRTLESEIQGIESRVATLEYAISSNTYKAKATSDIKQELTEYAANVKLEKSKQGINNAIKELNRAVDAYGESIDAIFNIAYGLSAIAEKVDKDDLKEAHEWFESVRKVLSCYEELKEFEKYHIDKKLSSMSMAPFSFDDAVNRVHKNANK